MAPKKQENRSSIIDAVKTPLGFFTLGILVTEAVLLALSPQAHGLDFTLLVMGALIGFFLMIIMVFVLVSLPKFRDALLGREPTKITSRIRSLGLSNNDIRFLVSLLYSHGSAERFVALPAEGGVKSLEQRAADLSKKGMLVVSKSSPTDFKVYRLTEDGAEVAQLIVYIARPFQRSNDIIL